MPSLQFLPGWLLHRGQCFCVRFQQKEDSTMAVGQARMTRSRRGMRRSHDALRSNALSTDATSGEVHRRHHVTPDGFYRGKKVVESKDD